MRIYIQGECHFACHNGIMIATLDQAGRIVVPKAVRDAMRLTAGDTFRVSIDGDRLVLAPGSSAAGLISKRGMLVFSSGLPGSQEFRDPVKASREARIRQILGDDISA